MTGELIDWRTLPDGSEKRQAYYCSPEWGRLRAAVRERAGGTCERCKKAPMHATHHLTYARLYAEELTDLQGVCEPCHDFVHGRREDDPAATPEDSVGLAIEVWSGLSGDEAAKRIGQVSRALLWLCGIGGGIDDLSGVRVGPGWVVFHYRKAEKDCRPDPLSVALAFEDVTLELGHKWADGRRGWWDREAWEVDVQEGK